LSIYKLLDRMLSVVESAPTVPFLSLKLVRSEALQDLIEQSVSELPEELAEARHLVSHEEHILSAARKKAAEIIAQAEDQAGQMLQSAEEQARYLIDESEVIKAINQEAVKIREQVRLEAQRVYQVAEQDIKEAEEESKRRLRLALDSSLVEAENIRRGANSYAEAVLHELERTTMGAISMIQNGQRQLESTAKQSQRAEHFHKFKSALSDVQNLPTGFMEEAEAAVASAPTINQAAS
jgi:cell division septum initiation protein DivIVA